MAVRRFQCGPRDEPIRGPSATAAGHIGVSFGGGGPGKACAITWDDTKTEHEILAAIDRGIAYLESDGRDNGAGFGSPLP